MRFPWNGPVELAQVIGAVDIALEVGLHEILLGLLQLSPFGQTKWPHLYHSQPNWGLVLVGSPPCSSTCWFPAVSSTGLSTKRLHRSKRGAWFQRQRQDRLEPQPLGRLGTGRSSSRLGSNAAPNAASKGLLWATNPTHWGINVAPGLSVLKVSKVLLR